jgi:3-oxoacyl-[acyl-carrier-protein] synthase II
MRVGVFGWGIVAPKSPNIDAFRRNLASSDSWLAPFNGFGPDNFLVGTPEFQFSDYRPWVEARFPPRRFQQLEEKMDLPALYAIGAFLQALEQNRESRASSRILALELMYTWEPELAALV